MNRFILSLQDWFNVYLNRPMAQTEFPIRPELSNFGAAWHNLARERNTRTKASSCSNQNPDTTVANTKATQNRRAYRIRPQELSSFRCGMNRPGGIRKKLCIQRQRR